MDTDLTYAYVGDITKAERDEAGDLLVYGKATGPDLDLDEQRCDPDWLRKAMPEWAEWSNVREMHQPICAGVGMQTEAHGDDWFVKSKVIDAGTAKKIEAGGLRGYSVGIKNPKVVKDASAPNGRIVGGSIVEISYVDRPCNPDATMAICKAVGADMKLMPVEAADAVDSADEVTIQVGAAKYTPADLAKTLAAKKTEPTATVAGAGDSGQAGNTSSKPAVEPAADEKAAAVGDATATDTGLVELIKQYGLTAEQAARVPAWLRPVVLAGKGALPPLKPGGKPRYPINSVQELKDAVEAIGRGKDSDKAEIKAHIKSEAKRLGRSDLVPDNWKTIAKDAGDGTQMTHDPAELKAILAGLVGCMKAELDELMAGENELCDLFDLLRTIQMFCRWWASEALGGETAEPYDMGDTMTYIGLGADADTAKTTEPDTEATTVDTETATEETSEVTEDATKTTEPDATKAAGSVEHDRLTELVKSATADLSKAFEERIAALEATNETLKTDLDKALALPEPGGPVLTRTSTQAAVARKTDAEQLQAQAQELFNKAIDVQRTDPRLAQGYRERAQSLLKQAA